MGCFTARPGKADSSQRDSEKSPLLPRSLPPTLHNARVLVDELEEADVQSEKEAPTPAEKLASLRELLDKNEWGAYVVPTADAHNSEYVAPCDKRRDWISGFTGSAGTAIITPSTAVLYTDGRYFVQAAKQLDSKLWTLARVGTDGVDNWDVALSKLPKGTKVGIDPRFVSLEAAKSLTSLLRGQELVWHSATLNPIDAVWGSSRPSRSLKPVSLYPASLAGKSAEDKLVQFRVALEGKGDGKSRKVVVSELSQIAWLLNLRGRGDIKYTPVFFAFLLLDLDVSDSSFQLFVDSSKIPADVKSYLHGLGGSIKPYGEVYDALASLDKDTTLLLPPECSYALSVAPPAPIDVVQLATSPLALAQAIKNPVELDGYRAAYKRDGLAWAGWAGWLEHLLKSGEEINEWDAGVALTERRKRETEWFEGLAYENISATGENAALPHYAPEKKGSKLVDRETPYLNDSGAQYLDGTIDTTRTTHFGTPTAHQKRAFTRVLQGHIAVDTLVFPRGTTGYQIDLLARRPGWLDGWEYAHGTGHGVGHYAGVHEGLHGIGGRATHKTIPFQVGHTTSNEPGYYEEGSFGIRIESIIHVVKADLPNAPDQDKWLKFERFTLVPIDPVLVDFKLLSPAEKEWLRTHNDTCWEALSPLLGDDEEDARAKTWLKKQRLGKSWWSR